MTPKQRMHAALAGEPVDRAPVAVAYHCLYVADHLAELTDKPAWWIHRLAYLQPEEYVELYRQIMARAPFDMIEPVGGAVAWEARARQEFIERKDGVFRHDTQTDEWVRLDAPTRSGYPQDTTSNQTRRVFTPEQVDQAISVTPADELFTRGELDPMEAAVAAAGDEHFVLVNGPAGGLGLCDWLFGQANTLMMLADEPALIEYVAQRAILHGVERIRRVARTGIDGLYFYDHFSTGDLVSPACYERFCLPVMQALVAEAKAHGLKTVVCYYGQVMDRLELIAQTGADALQAECAMKGYVNDIAEIVDAIGDRMTLFANINPITCLEQGTDEQLAAEIRRQLDAGQRARGFVLSPASPITPGTSLSRVQRFIELCHILSTR
jgi:hypothetical protein